MLENTNLLYFVEFVIAIIGSCIAAYLAHQAFEKRAVPFQGIPILPRYMVRKRVYLAGVVVYVIVASIIFIAMVFYYKEIHPWSVYIIGEELWGVIDDIISKYQVSIVSYVIFSSIIYFLLMKLDVPWNPLILLRKLVQQFVGIPRKATLLANMIKDNLEVPRDLRNVICPDENVLVNDATFELNRDAVERRWAEISYMKFWLDTVREKGDLVIFFNEPNIGYESIVDGNDSEYSKTANLVSRLVDGDQIDLSCLGDNIRPLHVKFCRLVACCLIYSSSSEKRLWEKAKKFGINSDVTVVTTRILSVLLFLVGVLISVPLGVVVSAIVSDFVNQDGLKIIVGGGESISGISQVIITKWTIYTVGMYFLPIFFLIMSRYIFELWDIWTDFGNEYFYAISFISAMLISGMVIAIGQKYFEGNYPESSLISLYLKFWPWTLAPSVMNALVAYRMDKGMKYAANGKINLNRFTVNVIFSGLIVSIIVLSITYLEKPVMPGLTFQQFVFLAVGAAFSIGCVIGALAGAGVRRSTIE